MVTVSTAFRRARGDGSAARHLRDTYAITRHSPGEAEFGYFSLEAWAEQGMPPDADLVELFD